MYLVVRWSVSLYTKTIKPALAFVHVLGHCAVGVEATDGDLGACG
jgi:hypothetical protein